MRKIIFVLMFVSLILVCIENAISSESVKLMAEDRIRISAPYCKPPSPNAAAVILYCDRPYKPIYHCRHCLIKLDEKEKASLITYL